MTKSLAVGAVVLALGALALASHRRGHATDPINLAAFQEARQDLTAMKRFLEGNAPGPR